MLPLSCRLSSATATVTSNRSFSSQISPDQGIQCMSSSPPAQGSSPRSFPSQISPDQGIQRTLSSAIATIASNRSFSSQVSSDQGIQCMWSSPRRKGAHRDPSPTRNATAQPGRSWPRRREAFLPLAKSYRMKGMPRASLQCRSHRGSIAVRIVMVRRRGEGSELNSCSYLGQCDAI